MAGYDEDVFGAAPKKRDKAETEAPEPTASGFDADVFSGGIRAKASASPLAPPILTWDDAPASGTGSTIADAVNAYGTGLNRGALALAGLPQDTLRNVWDLGKAGAALPWIARGKPVPKALELAPREDIPMTSQWLKKQAEKTGAGDVLLNPVNPEFEGGYTQLAGAATAGAIPLNRAMVPESMRKLGTLALGNVGITAGAKAVGDRYGTPLGITAGLAPTLLARPTLVEATKRMARGGAKGLLSSGEADRQRVADRIAEFEAAGAGPGLTMGLATGNKTIGGLENILYGTFGSSGVMGAAKDRLNQGIRDRVIENAQRAAGERSTNAQRTGEAIQSDVADWRQQFKGNLKDRVYRRTDALIDPTQPTTLTNTRTALANLNAEIPGLEMTSQRLLNADLRGIERDLTRDLSRTEPGAGPATLLTERMVRDPTLLTTKTEQVATPIPGGSPTTTARDTAPFMGVRRLRTLIGDKMSDNPMTASIPASKLDPFYAALSRDMEAQAALQDAQRAAHRQQGYDLPGGAARALEVQNRYFRQGMNRLGELEFYTGKERGKPVSAEDALSRYLDNAAAKGGNQRGLAAAKASMSPATRGQIAGNWLGDMGLVPKHLQNERGDAFSTESFLTNWGKKSPEGQRELLSGFPGAERVRQDAERTAKVSSLLRENSRMWANPSGTAAQQGLRTGLTSLVAGGLGALGGAPLALGAAAAPITAAWGTSKLLTNPGIVRAVAKKTGVDPKVLQARLSGLRSAGLLDSEEPFRVDIGLGLDQ